MHGSLHSLAHPLRARPWETKVMKPCVLGKELDGVEFGKPSISCVSMSFTYISYVFLRFWEHFEIWRCPNHCLFVPVRQHAFFKCLYSIGNTYISNMQVAQTLQNKSMVWVPSDFNMLPIHKNIDTYLQVFEIRGSRHSSCSSSASPSLPREFVKPES